MNVDALLYSVIIGPAIEASLSELSESGLCNNYTLQPKKKYMETYNNNTPLPIPLESKHPPDSHPLKSLDLAPSLQNFRRHVRQNQRQRRKTTKRQRIPPRTS